MTATRSCSCPPPTQSCRAASRPEASTIAPLAGTTFQQVGGDELLFLDQHSRQQPFVCIVTAPAAECRPDDPRASVPNEAQAPLLADAGRSHPEVGYDCHGLEPLGERLTSLADIVPWFTQNALVHYLSPRGLEQYSGGGWGTRDVCQGPVELLLAQDRPEAIRDLLLRVMKQQNPDGDWPQWFMFFERERGIRPATHMAISCSGHWWFWRSTCMASGGSGGSGRADTLFRLAGAGGRRTGNGLATRAARLLADREAPHPWHRSGRVRPRGLERFAAAGRPGFARAHVQRLDGDTAFPDSGRPGSRPASDRRAEDAKPLENQAQAVHRDFQRLLLVDGVLAGYAIFEAGGHLRYLLHPDDKVTGSSTARSQ